MALNTDVIGAVGTEPGGIDDVCARWLLGMGGTGAVALFAAYIPFGHGLGLNVVINRVASIAERTGGALQVAGGVVGGPPVCAGFHVIGAPNLVSDVPLGGKREVIVAYFLEVALFPFAAVSESDILEFESEEGIGLGEIRNDRLRVLSGIGYDIGHTSLRPARIGCSVARLAGGRSGIRRRRLCREESGKENGRQKNTERAHGM